MRSQQFEFQTSWDVGHEEVTESLTYPVFFYLKKIKSGSWLLIWTFHAWAEYSMSHSVWYIRNSKLKQNGDILTVHVAGHRLPGREMEQKTTALVHKTSQPIFNADSVCFIDLTSTLDQLQQWRTIHFFVLFLLVKN